MVRSLGPTCDGTVPRPHVAAPPIRALIPLWGPLVTSANLLPTKGPPSKTIPWGLSLQMCVLARLHSMPNNYLLKHSLYFCLTSF